MSLIPPHGKPQLAKLAYAIAQKVVKEAAEYHLAGRLYVGNNGWGQISVPSALVRGAFDALDEQGAELPPAVGGNKLNASIPVFSPAEVEKLGGPDKITERGHSFKYSLGRVKQMQPNELDASRIWVIEVASPALRNLRKSYGLSPTPKNGSQPFHIVIGMRRKWILQDSRIRKGEKVDTSKIGD
tara:strand:- start:1178 stop:1732 length:555 start_codon:yes stop_codon:yes gene_type:complete